jgi:hypothetical protein
MLRGMARKPARSSAEPASAAGTEARLHAASVKAGAGAALKVVMSSLPLLRPFLPARALQAAATLEPETVRRELVHTIYRRYHLQPASWEVESVLAVADTQALLSPLASRKSLNDLLKSWLPAPLIGPLTRYTPLEPLVVETAKAVATTWAAGRYADAVCRVRKAGMDWLPAPLGDALQMAPDKLRDFSAEALTLALPPLKLASKLGGQLLRATGRAADAAARASGVRAAPETKRPARGRASSSKRPARKPAR